MYELWLFLHVLGAIVAFGFGFVAPIFGEAMAREPGHGDWYLRAAKRVSNGVVGPVAITMFITGTLLVVETGGMRRFEQPWLAVSLVLYIIALGVVYLGQRPAYNTVISMTSGDDAPPKEMRQPATDPVRGLIRRLQVLGYVLLGLVIAIVALMVWKPVL